MDFMNNDQSVWVELKDVSGGMMSVFQIEERKKKEKENLNQKARFKSKI